MMLDSPCIRVLQASVDPDGDSDFRILVNDSVKYITVDAGLFGLDEMCFGPSLISLLPPLPPGEWTQARVSRDPVASIARFTVASETTLPGITSVWHPTRVNHLDLEFGTKLRSNVYEATSKRFPLKVVAKFARFPWEIPRLQAETEAYRWIEGHQIGPKFLGHLTEGARVIGFVMACIADCRPAALEDYKTCRSALMKLHRLAIKHGDINKHNFLIRREIAFLVDFENSSQTTETKELELELQCLQDSLKDASHRGGKRVETATGAYTQ
ncbi:uncharacterized protein EKO05_0010374 [Ascochyta rabiei]|uniref:uncharacterized protein n=1 Tax=Didymella rabiei TaxID=5454 RepID=UPI0019002FBA|nr:uncharacterized protein EKO05_0010374 [Ascochyta rabiei]UPX20130.1 hypothetical protein EKO05_0010374 [Ascochyta rabiei]